VDPARQETRRTLELAILPQPDLRTCGVTCLHSVYGYHGLHAELAALIGDVEHLDSGGTLAVMLACDSLRRGFKATIYTYNLYVFDPTWFKQRPAALARKLQRQAEIKHDPRLRVATRHYLDFLDLGGRVRFEDLNGALIRRFLNRGLPILTGLSATYLYGTAREDPERDEYDDVRGSPCGHFVVLCGYNREERTVRVADPLLPNPMSGDRQFYDVEMDRLIGAILLGIVTYDANLLVIEPRN
jgi:hypothetical protein